MGLGGIRQQAAEKLAVAKGKGAEAKKRRAFYRAVIIVCEAVLAYAARYAAEARRLAAGETNPSRRRELEHLAAICARVPRYPARTFWEALQAVWFLHIADEAEAQGSAQSFGRFDQYLYPYYVADLRTGRLTREQALELLQCFWLKCYKTFDFQYALIGGVKPDGSDGTNELSYLCLEATESLRIPRDLGVRVHAGTPEPFLRQAAEVASLGLGRPDFWNDEVSIEALTRHGIPLEEARDYAVIGCVEVTLPGRCNPRTMGHSLNLTKCLELALNNGRCQLTGERVGLPTGEHFATYAELHAAYRRQVAHFVRLALIHNLRAQQLQAEEYPQPFLSALTRGCLESGRDVMDGGAPYNPAGVNLLGIANVANALRAIKQLVFEERRVGLGTLRAALRNNFEGQERLRQQLLHRVAKFGNGEGSVDRIAAEEAAFYCEEVAKYRTREGGRFHPLIFATSSVSLYSFGPCTGASADGRRAGEPLAISCNPSPGTAVQGPTALLRSVTQLDFTRTPGGVSFILDLDPTAVEGPAGAEKLAALISTYFREGGMEMGLNVVGEETLRAAQREPERYHHLMVRVFGFSTQFVALDRATQEYIIQRLGQERGERK